MATRRNAVLEGGPFDGKAVIVKEGVDDLRLSDDGFGQAVRVYRVASWREEPVRFNYVHDCQPGGRP